MSYDQAVDAIVARMQADWITTPIRLQNDGPASPPRSADGSSRPWVYFQVIGGTDEQVSIGAPGSNIFRRHGDVLASVYVPVQSGDQLARQYAVAIGAIFRGQNFAGVTCEGASISGGEKDAENGLYWRRDVSIPFWVDETA